MSYFLGSKRCYRTDWGSRDLLSGSNRLTVAHQSSLVTYDCSIAATLSKYGCKVLSPQLSKTSKITSKSAKSVFDFLRLARSWLRIVAASGVNFSESVAAGAEFCFSSKSSASISSRSARSVSSCDRSSAT